MRRTPTILVVPDGAAEPVRGDEPTALEAARTPALDALARAGEVLRVRTIPEDLPAGTEVGLPGLLGIRLDAAPARGRLEAAAAGIEIGPDEGAWRLDIRPPMTPDGGTRRRLAEAVQALDGTLHHLEGHRFLLVGPHRWGDAPPGPHQTAEPLASLARGPFAGIAKAAKAALRRSAGDRVRAWPWGRLGAPLDWRADGERHGGITMLTTGGVAEGIGAAAGALVERIGLVDAADRAAAALAAGSGPGGLVVVHDGGPDDAAHGRDRAAKIRAIERIDAEVLVPLHALAAELGAELVVAADHGCDPRTGRHDATPVPAVRWRPAAAGPDGDLPFPVTRRSATDATGAAPRCTERAVASAPLVEAVDLVEPRSPLHRPVPAQVAG